MAGSSIIPDTLYYIYSDRPRKLEAHGLAIMITGKVLISVDVDVT